jgi:hypothetical protein
MIDAETVPLAQQRAGGAEVDTIALVQLVSGTTGWSRELAVAARQEKA